MIAIHPYLSGDALRQFDIVITSLGVTFYGSWLCSTVWLLIKGWGCMGSMKAVVFVIVV